MKIKFSKYHGTGNDFILIDNRKLNIKLTQEQISNLCHRRFGIGADGLMFLTPEVDFDFGMDYYNADGREGTMCGNGGRCITKFAHSLGLIKELAIFHAIDGPHKSKLINHKWDSSIVEIQLNDVKTIDKKNYYYLINSGSPHYIEFVKDLKTIDAKLEGEKIRWDERFQPEGINVNFVEIKNKELFVRTFERGVEEITYSCGTGVTASSIAAWHELNGIKTSFKIQTWGGKLEVKFNHNNGIFTDIWLKGPAVKVFDGYFEI